MWTLLLLCTVIISPSVQDTDEWWYTWYTTEETTTRWYWPWDTTENPSCRWNCGYHMGSCSCSSDCEWRGNCCNDYYSKPCEHSLFSSGTFTSPNHPNLYGNNTYCVWCLRTANDHRIFLSFTFLELENCCSCDYIEIYDGSYVGSPYLGKVCNGSQSTFHSSSKYMTVVFRTDYSVVARGFSADFRSSFSPHRGQVSCSSENMSIAIDQYYLSSLGYNEKNVYLNDPKCRPEVTNGQVVFNYPILSCGNIQEFESGRVLYTNTIRTYTDSLGEITRQSYFDLNVECRMEEDSKAQIICPSDSTYYAYHSPQDKARFTFRAFKFLRASESVYIQCQVLICQASDTSSRCRRGCVRRTARLWSWVQFNSKSLRKKKRIRRKKRLNFKLQ